MTNIFVYGTLRHIPLLEVVLGRAQSGIETEAAILPDHSVFAAREGAFPMVVSTPGSDASGLLVKNLSGSDLARLDYYEGGYGYTLHEKGLRAGQSALVYFPPPTGVTPGRPWSLRAWEDAWAELTCIAAHEVMGYMKTHSARQVAGMYGMIRARAASRLAARDARHGDGTLRGRIEITERRRIYADFFALDGLTFRHERFNGQMSAPLDRAVFIGADAAIVLPYDPARDRVLLVEQLRVGPIGRGDQVAWQYEPIAGRIDAGETPQDCVRREAMEEAGIAIQHLEPVAEAYPSPGTSSEFYYIYTGIADLPDDAPGLTGLEAEDEDIRTHLLSFEELMALVEAQAAANLPLALCAYWLARHRSRLRTMSAT